MTTDGGSSERRQRAAGWRRSFSHLCSSSCNTTEAAEETMKQPQPEVDGRESEKDQQQETLAKWQASLVDIMNLKDEMFTQPKRHFNWKHNRRLKTLERERSRVSELIKRSEQEISIASAKVNNNQPASHELPTRGRFCMYQSAKQAACEMMTALEDEEVSLIGLVGVRGAGKTTLAKLVAWKAQKSHICDQVLMIDSHSRERFEPDKEKIWHQMGILLGAEDTPQSAKSKLEQKLEDGKKMLIILDDVWWKRPDLEALGGIPYAQRCKILVITCLPQVCTSIGCNATIQLNGLTAHEASGWYKQILFWTSRSSVDFSIIHSDDQLAFENWEKQIVGASQGLPFSVVTTKEKLQKQESVDPTQNLVRCINEHVFNYLKLHYDYLSDQESKSFFILCSHFPEDHCPTLEQFTRYAYGALQRSFESIGSIHEARRKIHGLISNLQSYSLLEVHKDQVVKMPDLFRRLAHWIAEQDGQKILAGSNSNGFLDIFPSLSTACVSNKQFKDILGHDALECTKLENLIAFTKEEEEEEEEEEKEEEKVKDPVTYPPSVFKRMVNLKVLFLLDRTSSVETRKCLSLEGIQLLMDLRTLQLQGYKLRDLPSLGKLTNLETLCFISCDIDELLDVLGELSSLKLLELSCVKLPASVSLDWIGQLSKLEELYITDAGIEVPDMNSSINLKVKHLELNGVKGCRNLFPTFSKQGLNQLEILKLDKCDSLECLVDATELKEVQQNMEGCSIETKNHVKPVLGFPNLTNLELKNLGSLSCLWKGEAQISFEKLKVMVIDSCGLKCESLFPTHVVAGLKQLESLHICHCDNLKSISMEDPCLNSLCLPKLTTLKIESCSELEYVFPDAMAEGLPQLRELEIKQCNNLQHVFMCNGEASNLQTHALVLPELKCLNLEFTGLRSIRKGADILQAPLEEFALLFSEKLEPFVVTPKKEDRPRLKRLNLQYFGISSKHRETEISALRDKSVSLSRFMVVNSTELFDHEGDPYLSTLKHLRLAVGVRSTALWRDHSQVIGMQNIAHLELFDVKLRYVLTPSSARNIPLLMHLSITWCDKLEHIIDDDQPSGSLTAEAQTQYHPIYFPNLTEIEIKFCPRLKSLFPISFARFPKLKSFIVKDLASLTQIFTDQEAHLDVKYHQNSELGFPMLRKLSLVDLPSLVCFSPVGYHFTFPSMISLRIEACPQNNTRFLVDKSTELVYGKTEALSNLAASSSTSTTNTAQPLIPLPRFLGENYELWRVEMKTYLLSQDLWEIVKEGIDTPSLKEDKKRDAQALSIIQQAVMKQQELRQMITGANSAKDAWDILREKYQGTEDDDNEYKKHEKDTYLVLQSEEGITWPLVSYDDLNILEKELFKEESTYPEDE